MPGRLLFFITQRLPNLTGIALFSNVLFLVNNHPKAYIYMDIKDIELPSNKKFGIFFSIIFFIFGVYFFGSLFSSLFFTFSGIFIFTAILKPELLLPLNRLWMMFGILLGRIISPIILGLIFFGLFAPISIITRMFGRDELSLKIKSKKSFWKIRESESPHSHEFKLQF